MVTHARRQAKGDGLLTIYDVADRCTVSHWTVRRWIERGQLPVLRLPGRVIRVRVADLETFLNGRA